MTIVEAEPTAIEKPQPVELYGHSDQIVSLSERMRNMIPGATDAPATAIWQAAQIATLHKLDPFSGDVYVYPAYKGCPPDQWIVDIGVAAWRRAAQRQAKYSTQLVVLDDAETKERVGEHYTEGDVGVRCTLYRLDVARECKELGIPYEPAIAYGYFRHKARFIKSKNSWMADQLANTETKEDKARKRAEKKALKIAFSLDYADEVALRNADDGWSVVGHVQEEIQHEEMRRLPVDRPELNREEDGDLMYA